MIFLERRRCFKLIDKLVAKLYEKDPGAKVAYLTKFGSILYGTNTPESDTDYKGLYWPSIDSLIMNKIDRSVSFTTGDSHSRNNKDDTDAQLCTIMASSLLVESFKEGRYKRNRSSLFNVCKRRRCAYYKR